MTAERQPSMFIIVAKGMRLVCQDDVTGGHEHAFIFMDFDKAKDVALSYYNKSKVPCEICMLSSLTGAITPESLDSPMLDYLPQQISDVENATKNRDDLIRLQNACAEILEGAKEGNKCGH